MAAIDKLYTDSYEDYLKFKGWCEAQPLMTDKYGRKESICNYLYKYDEPFSTSHPYFKAPYYIDAYVIRNCPFEFTQKELMFNYGEEYYDEIKEGKRFASPTSSAKYEVGGHFKCTKHPATLYNRPFKCKRWFVDLVLPEHLGYMWYHTDSRSWDFLDEYVISDWNSSTAFVKTIGALKRLMIRWKLPVGTIVRATGRYIEDDYEFVITK